MAGGGVILLSMAEQRIGLADRLVACGRLPDTGADLCSQPTLSRPENAPSLKDAIRPTYALVEQWIACYEAPPSSVTLDIDDTCDLHTAAYWLMLTVRDAIPKPRDLAKAEFSTLRLRLIKIAARVIETASHVRLAFAAGHVIRKPGSSPACPARSPRSVLEGRGVKPLPPSPSFERVIKSIGPPGGENAERRRATKIALSEIG